MNADEQSGQSADFFDEATRASLASEDSEAWRAITGLLLAIIVGGVMIATLAVTLCSNANF